ncbi:MAG: DUF2846 domain-containing protein [Betaproteobacteria bacterium]
MKKVFAAFCLLIMSGCATVQMGDPQMDAKLKAFTPLKDKASLYVYRNEMFGAALTMLVMLDDKVMGQTGAKTYLHAELPPGKYRLTSGAENNFTLDFEAVAGKIYYVWQEVKMGLLRGRAELHMMDEKSGKAGVLESQLAATPAP